MRLSNASFRTSLGLAMIFALLLAVGVLSSRVFQTTTAGEGRELSSSEMATIFGDVAYPMYCQNTFACDKWYRNPDGSGGVEDVCYKCKGGDGGDRKVCCVYPKVTHSCDPSADGTACANSDLYTAPVLSTGCPASCNGDEKDMLMKCNVSHHKGGNKCP